jgi:hypothetical protein
MAGLLLPIKAITSVWNILPGIHAAFMVCLDHRSKAVFVRIP